MGGRRSGVFRLVLPDGVDTGSIRVCLLVAGSFEFANEVKMPDDVVEMQDVGFRVDRIYGVH